MATGLPIFQKGTPLSDNGVNATGSISFVEIAKITLQINKKYEGLHVNAHSRIGALLEVVYNDNGVETSKAHTGSDPGKPDPKIIDPDFFLDTTGKTGTQELILKFKNFSVLGCVRASISTRQF